MRVPNGPVVFNGTPRVVTPVKMASNVSRDSGAAVASGWVIMGIGGRREKTGMLRPSTSFLPSFITPDLFGQFSWMILYNVRPSKAAFSYQSLTTGLSPRSDCVLGETLP